MLGLALEGGGARGSFHIGAYAALREAGYEFGGIAGTSIGAINAAMIAQGDLAVAYKLWQTMDVQQLFDMEPEYVKRVMQKRIDKDALEYLRQKARDIIGNKGLDTTKIRQLLHDYIDEDKLRAAAMDYGLVTFSVKDLTPLELLKKEIPQGELCDYIMASASLPVFRLEPIGDKYLVDGGIYDNCPVNLLTRMGCDEIVEIRTMALGKIRKIEDRSLKVTSIFPSEDLGKVLDFEPQLVERNIKMGYYDALRAIRGYSGRHYYIDALQVPMLRNLAALPYATLAKCAEILELQGDAPRLFFEQVLPSTAAWLKSAKGGSYLSLTILMLELICEAAGVPKYAVYSYDEFLRLAQQQLVNEDWLTAVQQGMHRKSLLAGAKDERFCRVITEIVQAL